MKVMWVSASPIGPSSRILGYDYKGTSGGWIQTVYEEIAGKEIELSFLTFDKKVKLGEINKASNEEGVAFCLNMPKMSFGINAPHKLKEQIETIISTVQPDIIQIWGTETCVQNIIAECCPGIKKIVFMQGLIGIHNRYYGGNLRKLGIKYHKSVKEIIISIIKENRFNKQVEFENRELIQCGNVIIDSVFAASYCKACDPNIQIYYYRLNANSVFLERNWDYSSCERNTVFTVYGGGPDKGLHQLLKAIAIVKNVIPNVKVEIPGGYHIKDGRLSNTDKLTPYEELLKQLIAQLRLGDNIYFCGKLSPSEMADHLCRANVFVNPSCMEVHTGSLREAMSVGTPSVSSFCGSVCEFVAEGKSGLLYRYEEHEVLAYKIIEILRNEELAKKLSINAKNAMNLYRKEKEQQSMIDIYKKVLEG